MAHPTQRPTPAAAAAGDAPPSPVGPSAPPAPPAPDKKKEPIAGVDYPIMQCPHCLSTNTVVVPDAQAEKSNGAWRRRMCKACKQPFKEALNRAQGAK